MPERNGKDQVQDSSKQACPVLVRLPWLISHKKWRELCILRAFIFFPRMSCRLSWCYVVCSVLFRFRLFDFIQAVALRRYFQHAHFIPIVGVGKTGEY